MEHPEQISVPTMIEAVTATRPDKVALWFDDRPLTYTELVERAWAMANSLQELGLRPGDTVASLMDNCEEHAYLFLAASYAGLLEVAINTSFRGPFLSHQLRVARSQVVLVDKAFVPNVLAVASDLPDLRWIIVRGDPDIDTDRLQVASTDSLLAGDRERPSAHQADWTDPCSVQFTSGTTGPSKGAVLSQNYLVTWARQFSRAWCSSEEETFLSTTPLFHMAAKGVGLLGSLYCGASCAIDSRFSVSNFWNRVDRYDAVSTVLLGPMLTHVWNLPATERDRDVPLRNVIAAPIPPHLHRPMEKRFGFRFFGMYGMSEAAPIFLAGVDGEDFPAGTSGRVNAESFEARVVDDDDNPVPPGVPGEVVCRPRKSHVMFEGYYEDPASTVAVTKNLWFHTGDIATLDEDGNLVFVDRKKDYLRKGGENISSFEAESAISQHPDVSVAVVIAVPSAHGEDDVMAVVVLRDGVSTEPADLLRHCVENMPHFAVPRYFRFVDTVPVTPSQKVEKYKLRAEGVTSDTWDREQAGFRVDRRGLSTRDELTPTHVGVVASLDRTVSSPAGPPES